MTIQDKLTAAVSRRLNCRVVHMGQVLPDGTTVPDGIVDGRAESVYAVPAPYVAHAVALGLRAVALEGTK